MVTIWMGKYLYNKKVLDQVFLMIKDWKLHEILQLNKDVQKYGLKSKNLIIFFIMPKIVKFLINLHKIRNSF